MNRVELVGETMRRALDDLASVATEWLLAQMKPEWGERYSRKMDTHRIRTSADKLQTLALTIGGDGYDLLQAVYKDETPLAIRSLSSIETLRRIWVQQYYSVDTEVQWREKGEYGLPPSRQMLASPDDLELDWGRRITAPGRDTRFI